MWEQRRHYETPSSTILTTCDGLRTSVYPVAVKFIPSRTIIELLCVLQQPGQLMVTGKNFPESTPMPGLEFLEKSDLEPQPFRVLLARGQLTRKEPSRSRAVESLTNMSVTCLSYFRSSRLTVANSPTATHKSSHSWSNLIPVWALSVLLKTLDQVWTPCEVSNRMSSPQPSRYLGQPKCLLTEGDGMLRSAFRAWVRA